MKIYGTAKGGAIGKKDFGVAFGGSPAPSESCPVEDETSGNFQITSTTYANGLSVQSGSEIVGKNITKISFNLKRVGSLTGTVYVRAWDSSSDIPDTVGANFGSFTANDLPEVYEKKTFDISEGEYTVLAGSQIGIDWGPGTHVNAIYMNGQNSASAEGKLFNAHSTGGTPYEEHNLCPNYCYFGS